MKKLLLFILLAVSISGLAQEKLTFDSYLDLGYSDQTLFLVGDNEEFIQSDYLRRNLYSNLTFECGWKNFTLDSDIFTHFVPVKFYKYNPRQITYSLELEYQFKNISIHAGHLCSHSIEKHKYHFGYNRVGIKIHFINH